MLLLTSLLMGIRHIIPYRAHQRTPYHVANPCVHHFAHVQQAASSKHSYIACCEVASSKFRASSESDGLPLPTTPYRLCRRLYQVQTPKYHGPCSPRDFQQYKEYINVEGGEGLFQVSSIIPIRMSRPRSAVHLGKMRYN